MMVSCQRVLLLALASTVALTTSAICRANDNWEPDDTPATASSVNVAGHPPQLRDLQASGGVADQDWMQLYLRSHRSYEVRISNTRSAPVIAVLQRWNSSGNSLLQSAPTALGQETVTGGGRHFLRWQTGDLGAESFGPVNLVRIMGSTTATSADSDYVFQFRETTLYCPRFNNAGSQASVLLIQWAGDGENSCSMSAHFFEQTSRALLATLPATLNAGLGDLPAAMQVYALSSIAGLEGQRGSAHIAHTCGYGNLKAKLVALEPATGFSFDTPCTMREQ